MISHERGLYIIVGITFTRLFENVIYHPKSIFLAHLSCQAQKVSL